MHFFSTQTSFIVWFQQNMRQKPSPFENALLTGIARATMSWKTLLEAEATLCPAFPGAKVPTTFRPDPATYKILFAKIQFALYTLGNGRQLGSQIERENYSTR